MPVDRAARRALDIELDNTARPAAPSLDHRAAWAGRVGIHASV